MVGIEGASTIEPILNVTTIPATYFFCPYWMLSAIILIIFFIGIGIGYLKRGNIKLMLTYVH